MGGMSANVNLLVDGGVPKREHGNKVTYTQSRLSQHLEWELHCAPPSPTTFPMTALLVGHLRPRFAGTHSAVVLGHDQCEARWDGAMVGVRRACGW